MPAYTDPQATPIESDLTTTPGALTDHGERLANILFGTLLTHDRMSGGVVGANVGDGLYAIADAIRELAAAIAERD